MSLNIEKIQNQSNYAQQTSYASKKAGVSFSSQPDTVEISTKDKAKNGKFDLSEAIRNFGQGLVSPITSMFESKRNFAVGVGTILASAALVVATGGAAAPLLVIGGLALGGLQSVKALGKLFKAKNGDDVEKAFYDVGGATSSIGLSLLGAKSSLKQAGVQTKNMTALDATGRIFKDTKALFGDSVEMFKTGYFKTNLKNALRPYLYNPRIRSLGRKFARNADKTFKADIAEIRNILPPEFHSMISGRPKCKTSIIDKLINRATYRNKISKIKRDAALSSVEKKVRIDKLKADSKKFQTDKVYAKQLIDDLVGTRLVIKDPVPENIDKIVSSLVNAIKEDKLNVLEVKNYRGPECDSGFYFSKSHIAKIDAAAKSKGYNIKFLEDSQKIKHSGYCAVQVKVKHKSGAMGELQIRGEHVDEVANWEHIPYDLRQGKNLAKGHKEMGKLLYPFKKAVKSLSDKQYKEYENYMASVYRCARDKELGKVYPEPVLPEGFDKTLSADSLRDLYRDITKLNITEEKYYTMLPTSAFTFGIITNSDGK